MDPYIRDQLATMKSGIEKSIQITGKYEIKDYMKISEFDRLAKKLAELEALDIHLGHAFDEADREATNMTDFDAVYETLSTSRQNNRVGSDRLIVVQRIQDLCRTSFQKKPEPAPGSSQMDESQDLAIVDTLMATRDPFTKCRLREPLVNTNCQHVYERETIYELLDRNKKVRCPVVGCRNQQYITRNHLFDDINVREQLRTQASQESDENETIEDSALFEDDPLL